MVIITQGELSTRRKRSVNSDVNPLECQNYVAVDISSRCYTAGVIDSGDFGAGEYEFLIGDGEDGNRELIPGKSYTVHVAVTVMLNVSSACCYDMYR